MPAVGQPHATPPTAPAPRAARAQAAIRLALAVIAFTVLVTANSAGYRYGVSDQAFYVPAVESQIDPQLFPHDRAIVTSQARLTVIDEILAAVATSTGMSLPVLFAAGYLLTAGLFVAGALLVADALSLSSWAAAAFLLALTLRHRLADTGVNSYEGYFHPRVLAFALGVLAMAALMRSRHWLTAGCIVLSLLAHPTTGCWFAAWALVAWLSARQRPLAGLVIAGVAGVVALAAAVVAMPDRFVVMDPAWLSTFGARDYLFATSWPAGTWIVNAIAPAIVAAVYVLRRRLGLVSPAERGIRIGALALVAAFLLTLPLVAARLAIAVQMQVSRVFWPVEFLAVLYLVWLLVDAPWGWAPARSTRRLVVVALLLAVSVGRGAYILAVQFHRPLARVALAPGDWSAMGEWARRATPAGAQFLVDPSGVERDGVTFRVAAARDVFVEPSKDPAIAIYSSAIAARVRERLALAPDVARVTEPELRAFAARHGVGYLVTGRTFTLPLLHESGVLKAYALMPPVEVR